MNEVYEAAGLTAAEIQDMPEYISGEKEFYGTVAFDKLFEHFAFDTGEMPYDIAKARTETPDVWILDRVEEEEAC
jgi:hypothetical protein